MEHLFWVWLAFNIVFGLWSARNWFFSFWAACTNRTTNQSELGYVLDLIVPVSILTMFFMVNFSVDGSNIVFSLK